MNECIFCNTFLACKFQVSNQSLEEIIFSLQVLCVCFCCGCIMLRGLFGPLNIMTSKSMLTCRKQSLESRKILILHTTLLFFIVSCLSLLITIIVLLMLYVIGLQNTSTTNSCLLHSVNHLRILCFSKFLLILVLYFPEGSSSQSQFLES